MMAIAYAAGRASIEWLQPLYFPGLAVLFVPGALALMSWSAPRSERLTLVVLLALGLYAADVLGHPTDFPAFDSLLHRRTAVDIMETGSLFKDNPLLPASAFYPALEILITALTQVTAMDVFAAGLVVVAVARLVLVLSVFLLYESVADSSRIAGIGAVLYMANPLFYAFDAQIAYESLAISLAIAAIFALLRVQRRPDVGAPALAGLAALLVVVTAFTHHLTSFALAAFLVVWALLSVGYIRRPWGWLLPACAMLSIAANASWLVLVATSTLRYLSLPIGGAIGDLLRLISGEATVRQPFTSAIGTVQPLFERVVGSGAALVLAFTLPYALVLLWQRYRNRAAAVMLGLAALAYPAGLPLRFVSTQGAEASFRVSGFVFLGVGFVVALAVDRQLRPGRLFPWKYSIGAIALATVFLGGAIVGTTPWLRLPGPYQAGADERSVELEGIAAASWALRTLGPDNRIIADRTNRLLMGTYGHQTPVEGFVAGRNVAEVFLSPQFGPDERTVLRNADIAFIVVDRRLSSGLPFLGFYFTAEEQQQGPYRSPLDPKLLEKFETVGDLKRVFDSGDIVIYDARGITRAR